MILPRRSVAMAFHKAVSSRYQKETSEIRRYIITRRRQLCDLVKEAEKVCVCERERVGRQKKEKTGGIVDKKEICHSGRRKRKDRI